MSDTPIEPHLFVVLGGTGDLMQRKLLPALFHLMARGPGRERCHVLAAARSARFDDKSYRAWARESLLAAGLPVDGEGRAWCEECLHYQSLGGDAPGNYRRLVERITGLEREQGLPGNRIFDLALPPEGFSRAVLGLGEAGLNRGPGWTRIVVEKPFGRDLESARALNELLHRYFEESQVYRIDHYLGKDTVQNLLTFRFANAIFESLWNRDRVARVAVSYTHLTLPTNREV